MLGNSSKNIDILNKALETEQFVISVYEMAVNTGLLNSKVKQLIQTFQLHHGQHARKIYEVIKTLGGTSSRPSHIDENTRKLPSEIIDEKSIIHYAITLEKEAAITYLKSVSELEYPNIVQLAASIMGDESMHWAILRSALGLTPVNISFIPLSDSEIED